MKKIKYIISAVLIFVLSCALSIAVNAAGKVYTEADGIRTVYIASTESVTISDGTTRNAFGALHEGLSALGTDGGKAYICGTVEDATADGYFSDVVRTSNVLVTGLAGNGSDNLRIGCTMNFGGNITFENFKLTMSFSGGRYMTGGPGTKTFGKGFSIEGNIYYRNYHNISASVTEARTVFASPNAKFAQVSAGGQDSDLGNASMTEPALAELVFDSVGKIYGNYIILDYNNRDDRKMYGNVNIIVNAGDFSEGASISSIKGNEITGVVTVILNNGTAEKISNYNKRVDYIVKSALGGKVSIKSQAPFGGAPTFEFAPEGELIPVIDGTVIAKNGEGKYLYTPSVSENQQILNVAWSDGTDAAVYLENGQRTAYVSSSTSVTLSDNSQRATFPTLSAALVAVGENGGKVYICGTVEDTTADGYFNDVVRSSTVLVTGLAGDGSDNLRIGCSLNFGGNITFENFKLTMSYSGGRYMTGGPGTKTFGKGFAIEGNIYYRNYHSISTSVTEARTVFASPDAKFAQVSAGGQDSDLGNPSSTEPALAELVFDSVGKIAGDYIIIDYNNRDARKMYGNVNIIVNAGDFSEGASIGTVKGNEITGVVTAILNNGMAEKISNYNSRVNYIVKSSAGGKVSIKSQAPFGGAPTFLLTPEGKATPVIDGRFISADNEGNYIYTPAVTTSQTVINVTWESTEPEVYTIDGNTCVFVRNGGGALEYANEVRYAYEDVNTAVAALGTDSGYVYISGTVEFIAGEPTDTNTFADVADRKALYIRGIDNTNPVLNYYRSMDIAGDLDIDSLTYHRLNGTLYDTGFVINGYNLTLGESFITTSDFSAQVMTIHGTALANRSFDTATVTVKGGKITRIAPGSTYSGLNVTGNTVVNIEGGIFEVLLGGSHGGASKDSVYNGNVIYNISGGTVSSIYTGVNNKTGINGNVTINISGGIFNSSELYHGNVNHTNTNYLNGNSAFIISGGDFENAVLGGDRGVTGEEIFIIAKDITGYSLNNSSNGTVIIYDTDGSVAPEFADDGELLGYRILCDDDDKYILIDGEMVDRNDDNIYSIGRGSHSVNFSELCEISFDLNGAEGDAPESITRYTDMVIELDAPDCTYKNHTFVGWSIDKNAVSGSMTYTVPSTDSVLYAIWSETKPEVFDTKDIENSGASEVIITSIRENKYDTHASVVKMNEYIDVDPSILSGAEVCYAFSVRAFDEAGNTVSEYENGIDLRIPKSVLPERKTGEYYRIYKVESSASVSLMSEDITFISYMEDENYLYFTDVSSGDYAVMLVNPTYATYIYKTSYSSVGKVCTVEIYFKGADACYGTFGLKYDTTLMFESITFEDGISDCGITSITDGGFETYYNENGVYQTTWKSDSGVFAAAGDGVKIATMKFKGSDTFKDITEETFECASIEETDLSIDKYTMETVSKDGFYLYAPMVPSLEVYCQPTIAVFEVDDSNSEYSVKISYTLVRESGYDYIYSEGEYDTRAIISVLDSEGNVIITKYESDCEFTENENGQVVLNLTFALVNGEYSIVFSKNGYVSHTASVTVDGTDNELENAVLLAGDIKATFEDICGDGIVDIDDFVRVLRGFSSGVTDDLRRAVDINEDGVVSVQDLAYIKANFGKIK